MIRTQLQLDDATYTSLRRTAHRRHKSMSAVARDILREHLLAGEQHKAPSLSFIGAGASGRKDISVHHDEALSEDFR